MQAIQIAVQASTSPGDELVYLTPAWPNIAAALEIAGARSVGVELQFGGGKWAVDLNRIEAAITPKTRALFINTPSNPTGWTATKRDLANILELARKLDLWIMAGRNLRPIFLRRHPCALLP